MRRERPGRPRFSLVGKVTALFLGVLVLVAALAAFLSRLELPAWQVFLLCVGLALPVGAWLIGRMMRPVSEVVQALDDAVRSLKDGDFSVRLAVTRGDELGRLVAAYDEAVDVLREERSALRQRELLLETALQRSPLAIVLTNALDRVIFANVEARRLLLGGDRLEGRRFAEIVEGCPRAMREVLAGGGDGLFAVEVGGETGEGGGGETETYHLSQRSFQLNHRRHTLYLLRRLTQELTREEVRIWKKVIRIISHELNNSLAPISSLVHSAGIVIEKRPGEEHRLGPIFASIEERVSHLKGFLEGYARFARLPRPQKEAVPWRPFLESLQELYPFRLEGEPPTQGLFDPAQMQQVLINLLKNAIEASPGGSEVTLRVVSDLQGGTLVQVLDRGTGMDEETLRRALLPFYSTKAEGAGVGLPLSREILAGHGGTLRLESREGGGTTATCWLPAG